MNTFKQLSTQIEANMVELLDMCQISDSESSQSQQNSYLAAGLKKFKSKPTTLKQLKVNLIILNELIPVCHEKMSAQLKQLQVQVQNAIDQTISLESQLESAQKQQKEDTLTNENLRERLNEARKKQLDTIESLIAFADGLETKLQWLEDSTEKDSNGKKVITNLLLETQNLLKKENVSIIDETGTFDSSKQTSVETIATDDETLVGQIAKTFRKGYYFADECLRAQEVVVYVAQ